MKAIMRENLWTGAKPEALLLVICPSGSHREMHHPEAQWVEVPAIKGTILRIEQRGMAGLPMFL